jgi:APA family basic amino acid/polyamine antiporter
MAKILAPTKFETKHSKLAQVLSLFNLTLLGIAGTIGAGAYSVIGKSVHEAGPSAMVTVAIVGVLCIFTSFPYAEFAANNHSTGYAYAYIGQTCGELMGYVSGLLIISSTGVAASLISRCLGTSVVTFLTSIGLAAPGWLCNYELLGLHLNLLAGFAILLICILLLCGMKESTTVSNIITSSNIVILVLCIIVGSFYVNPTNYTNFFPKTTQGMFKAIGLVFYMYLGFEAVTCFTEEAKTPKRDIPIALGLVLLAAILVYGGLAIVVAGFAPSNTLTQDDSLVQAFLSRGLKGFSSLVCFGSVVGMFSTVVACLLSLPRVFYSISRDNLLPSVFMATNPKTKVPDFAIIIICLVSCVLSIVVDVESLGDLSSLTGLWVSALVDISVIVARYSPAPPNPRKEGAELALLPAPSSVPEASPLDEMFNPESSANKPSSSVMVNGLCVYFVILTIFVGFSMFYQLHWALWTSGCVLILGIALFISLQKQTNIPLNSPCPFVPFFPLLGCLSFLWLGTTIKIQVWGVGGLVVLFFVLTYFCYGYRHGYGTTEPVPLTEAEEKLPIDPH